MIRRLSTARRTPLRHCVASVTAVLASSMLLPQCDFGGLRANDFVKISENGFDAEDNAQDKNDYAWSMTYFEADGADTGYVYVGTGNDIFGIAGYISLANINGEEPNDLPARPPEIRRYRPDLGPTEWEKVFDYRDVESDELQTYGFRRMVTYNAVDTPSKGVPRSNYIYAASQGAGSSLWRSKTGDPGDWEMVFSTGLNHASLRGMTVHNGNLYIGFAFDIFNQDIPPAEIWKSEDGINFEPIMQDGFGNPNNRGIESLISYNGWLYAGTKNDEEGYEVWKLEGPDKGAGFIKVVEHGGPDRRNEAAGTSEVFQNKLYIGSLIFYGVNARQGYGFKGCDIIRVDEDDNWETVVGPNSISGYKSGFNYFTNSYCWQLREHDGWLYASTWDDGSSLADLLHSLPQIAQYFASGQTSGVPETSAAPEYLKRATEAGGDIFKTQDGIHWFPVTQCGLGNRDNYGWRNMLSAPNGYLYLGSANPYDGLEIWRGMRPETVPQ